MNDGMATVESTATTTKSSHIYNLLFWQPDCRASQVEVEKLKPTSSRAHSKAIRRRDYRVKINKNEIQREKKMYMKRKGDKKETGHAKCRIKQNETDKKHTDRERERRGRIRRRSRGLNGLQIQ